MHICFITASMVGGGTERVIAVLANYFAKQGKKVTILMTAGDKVEYELHAAVQLLQIGTQTGGKLSGRMQRIQKLRTYLRKHKNTVFLSFGTETNMFVILAAWGFKGNILLSERNDPHQCNFQTLRNVIYFFGKKFVFQTEDAKRFFSKRIQKCSTVIPNPVSEQLPQKYVGERRKVIAAVGRLDTNKNHELLINAFADFHKKYQEYELHIYGKGELREHLQSVIDEKGLQEYAVLQGFCENVLETIKNCAVYVLCSNSEGLSNALMEAMAMGLPVIATDCPIGGARMLIRDHENGILIPVGDKAALCQAMKELAENRELADKLSAEAAKVKEDYAVDKIAVMWENVSA